MPAQAGRPEYADRVDSSRNGVLPTDAHMGIVTLMRQGLCRFLISSNCEGVHLKSGVDPKDIVEVHGNSFVEACSVCGRCFHRGLAKV